MDELLSSALINPDLLGPTLPAIPPFTLPTGPTGPTGSTGPTGPTGRLLDHPMGLLEVLGLLDLDV